MNQVLLYNADMRNVFREPAAPPVHGDDTDAFTAMQMGLQVREQIDARGGVIDLLILDPPWRNVQKHGTTSADSHYDTMSTEEIIEHCAPWVKRSRLVVCFATGWILGEFMVPIQRWNAYPVSAGAWVKPDEDNNGHYGQGYWWAGCSEPVLLYHGGVVEGRYNNRAVPLRNSHHERPSVHSRKPVAWLRQMIQRWCRPGGLVADPFAGTGSSAEATIFAGEKRAWVGCEVARQRFLRAGQNIMLATAQAEAFALRAGRRG